MRWFLSAVLYTALALGANPASAGNDNLQALRQGTMKKLVFNSAPKDVPQIVFKDPQGGEHRLQDWRGKYVVVNFWATWCAPCRKEMPALEALETEFGGDKFAVVTIATTRNTLPAINQFFGEIGVKNLPILIDENQALARPMGVFGLPTTVMLNPEGKEIARVRGDADWYSDSARAIIAAWIAGS
jgi:thiol-disulfide isomerase/thioredoxin